MTRPKGDSPTLFKPGTLTEVDRAVFAAMLEPGYVANPDPELARLLHHRLRAMEMERRERTARWPSKQR